MTATTHQSARPPALHLGLALGASLLAAAAVGPKEGPPMLRALDTAPEAAISYAAKNPSCIEWSDACIICKRGEGDKAACSTAAIACVSGDMVCKLEKAK